MRGIERKTREGRTKKEKADIGKPESEKPELLNWSVNRKIELELLQATESFFSRGWIYPRFIRLCAKVFDERER